jgi:hypothetical protein
MNVSIEDGGKSESALLNPPSSLLMPIRRASLLREEGEQFPQALDPLVEVSEKDGKPSAKEYYLGTKV